MPGGVLCNVTTSGREFEKYNSDIIHPCIRYSEQKFRGYNWWLVYTPYFKADASLENPILCCGDSDNGNAPLNWNAETLIRDTPEYGYNSDPTLFFKKDGLHVFWRENDTPRTRCDNAFRGTYGLFLSETNQQNVNNPILVEKDRFEDKEVSPTIIYYNGGYRFYAAHLKFKNKKLHFKNKILEKISNIILWGLSLSEIYNEQKSYGIAIWESNTLEAEFIYKKTTLIDNCNKLYHPWHFDFFEYNNKLYMLIQTNKCNSDICIAVSKNYENFRMYKKPLVTSKGIRKFGIYKPTGVVHDGIFYLYYTAQDIDARGNNKLYCTKYQMEELLIKLDS